MSVKLRQELERRVITAFITSALAHADGYSLDVNDGEETTLRKSRDRKAILKAMFTTDEDWLHVRNAAGKRIGWVRLIYGNDGWDVINDYTTNLEHLMGATNKLIERYS